MLKKIELYLKENIDEQIIIKPWLKLDNFSVFLKENYDFYEMVILKTRCILFEAVDDMPSISNLLKQIKQVERLTEYKAVVLCKDITTYRRKSLIENKIPFVIEDGQMYFPFLGLDIKKGKEYLEEEIKEFSTSAQIAYLYFLYNKDVIINTTNFAETMNINKMAASRALNELYHANLITYEIGGMTGRSKEYKRIQDPDYFLIGRNYLKSPVRKVVYTKTKPSYALTSGVNALAELSMINPPDHPIVAIDRNKLNQEQIEIVKNRDIIKDMRMVEVELWDYDPRLFSNSDHVDLLSLYASLKEDSDERIEQALEDVLRGEVWYTG